MTEEPKRRLSRHGGRAARAFFWLTPDWRLRVYGFTIENEEKLRGPGRHSFGPEFDRRGFPAYPEPPRLLIDPKRGRPPSDCDWYGGYWIVSDKLKAVLDAVDPDACAFVKCDVRHAQGKATDGGYWLMDIVRNLDAVDESASRRLNIRHDARLARGKSYGLTGLSDIVFKSDVVGSAHLFGLTFALGSMFCDGELKDALRRAGIKGISFEPARRSKAQEAALAKVLAFREIKASLQATPKVSLDDDPFERIYPFERIEEDKAPPE